MAEGWLCFRHWANLIESNLLLIICLCDVYFHWFVCFYSPTFVSLELGTCIHTFWTLYLYMYMYVLIIDLNCPLQTVMYLTTNKSIFLWDIVWWEKFCILTPSLRRPFKHAIFFSTACRTVCKHAFRFLRVLPEAVSTRHSWLWQTLDDVYTCRCFSESEGTRFGAPGQKALPSVNEFTLLWIFA